MKKLILSLLAVITLTACSLTKEENKDYEALDYVKEPEIVIKTPEEWLELVNKASAENDDIASYLDTQTCIPTSSKACQADNTCKEAQPSVFLFVSTFDPATNASSSLTRHVYRCDELSGCEKREYSSYEDKDGTLKLQAKDREIRIGKDSGYEEDITLGVNTTTNKGKCYYRDELGIASAKIETVNKMDQICTVPESDFSIDWIGVNGQFTLKNDTELRASPIVMDCNVLTMVPKGQIITLQRDTNGAFNGEDSFIWLKISFEGQTGWVRGDYVDDQFKH